MNVIILAAGHWPTTTEAADDYPVCLAEMNSQPLIELIVQNAAGLSNPNFVFAMLDIEVRRYRLDSVSQRISPGSRIVHVLEGTMGSACTALLAACDLDPDQELLIVSANELVALPHRAITDDFRQRDLDAGVLVFRSVHPRFSYVRLDDNNHVLEAAQRNPISHHATTGLFWFRRTGDFVDAAKNMIRKDASVEGHYYICPALNELLLRRKRVGASHIDNAHYLPIKTERQRLMFEQISPAGSA